MHLEYGWALEAKTSGGGGPGTSSAPPRAPAPAAAISPDSHQSPFRGAGGSRVDGRGLLSARSVPGLAIDAAGKVTDIKEDPEVTLKKLIDQYVELSGQIVKNALGSIYLSRVNPFKKQD